MSKLKLDEDILYQGIKKWEERLVEFGGGIPWEFYIEYVSDEKEDRKSN